MLRCAPMFQVDAFTNRPFSGNPAAVCLLDDWPSDQTMQAIAAENNLSETAFYNPNGKQLTLRWFTPKAEVNLCGHATLATAFVLFRFVDTHATELSFQTQSGELKVRKVDNLLVMDFPSDPPKLVDAPAQLAQALGVRPLETLRGRDYMAVLENEQAVRDLKPNFDLLKTLPGVGVIVTAKGDKSDFVSRFFAPQVGLPEDPVTGSTHCALTPYWSEKIGRKDLYARQLSERGGELWLKDNGERTEIAGQAVCFFEGKFSY